MKIFYGIIFIVIFIVCSVCAVKYLKYPKYMNYNLLSDGRICSLENSGGCFDLIQKKGVIEVPYWGRKQDGVAVLNVEDDVTCEIMSEALDYFSLRSVPKCVFRRKNGTKEETFSYVVPLMGGEDPIRQAMDRTEEGYFDNGGEIKLGEHTVISLEVMNDGIFFGAERVSDDRLKSALESGYISAVLVRFRRASNLSGLWRIVRYNNKNLEIILLK